MPAPEWFTSALAAPYREGTVTVGGCPIHYLEWGELAAPGLVMVHGGAAHAHWWSFLAPMFTYRWRVVAPDLSGHGDSGHRQTYSLEAWAEEVLAVAEQAAFPAPPVVVGHSLGGVVAARAAVDHCDRLGGVVMVDSPVRRPDPESQEGARGRAFRSPGTYSTLDEALAHFHLVPQQPVVNPFIVEHVARHSLRQVPGGWTWKFDAGFYRRPRPPLGEDLARARCRLALLYGEHSAIVPPDLAAYMTGLMGPEAPVVPIPDAYHHLILDQPLAFVAALRTLLAAWGK
jgi:pimeloyl-ACP methyl ester carboxylesterase